MHITLNVPIDENLKKAQQALNMAVVGDTEKYVPFRQGALRGSVTYPEGIAGGVIEYNTPYAHYLYVGDLYEPNFPIKDGMGNLVGFYSPPVKYPSPAGRKLTYHEAGTTDHWFEKSKGENMQKWRKVVADALLKG